MTRFEGFGPKVRKWFKGLEADSSKEYFSASREFFEESIRDQMEALLIELSEKFGGEVKVFRQNRDIRFSPDKSPYKTNTYGGLSLGATLKFGRGALHGLERERHADRGDDLLLARLDTNVGSAATASSRRHDDPVIVALRDGDQCSETGVDACRVCGRLRLGVLGGSRCRLEPHRVAH